jgi:hypothetical protein
VKWFLTIWILLVFSSCAFEKGYQVQSHSLVLVKIDTMHRDGNPDGLILTWVTDEKDTCYEFAPMGNYYLGMTDKAKLRR